MPDTDTRAGLDLEAIEGRVNAATRGPWKVQQIDVELSDLGREKGFTVASFKQGSITVTTQWHHGQLKGPLSIIGMSASPYREPAHLPYIEERDADFIAHAREDVPALLAEVRRLRLVAEAARNLRAADKAWGEAQRDGRLTPALNERHHAARVALWDALDASDPGRE